jgi:putative nucleotidyltransferase with HDIG domain
MFAAFPPEFHPLKQETNRAVLNAARASGVQVCLVGGYVRDALLGRFSTDHPPCDFDYTVIGGSALQFGKQLELELGGNYVLLDKEQDTCRLVLPGQLQIDLAGCVGGNLHADLRRRDLTINALAWDPDQPDVIVDTHGGLVDLQEKRIRAISEQSFIEDPVRLLRAFRFAAALDFALDATTVELVCKHAQLLARVAGERVSYEMFAILETPRAAQAFQQMSQTGLLEIIFPELTACHNVPPNAFHHLGLFDHSMQALIECEQAFPDLPPWARESCNQPLSHNLSRIGATKLGSLLHDIGKPATWTVREDGKHTFIGHDKLGATMIEDTARRLKWSKNVERFLAALIRWHLRPGALFHQGPPTERALYRFYRDVGEEVPPLILLAQADFRATRGPGLEAGREVLEKQLIELLQGYNVFREGKRTMRPLCDGHDIMEWTSCGEGPHVGEILAAAREAQALGVITDKQQARDFVVRLCQEKYSK